VDHGNISPPRAWVVSKVEGASLFWRLAVFSQNEEGAPAAIRQHVPALIPHTRVLVDRKRKEKEKWRGGSDENSKAGANGANFYRTWTRQHLSSSSLQHVDFEKHPPRCVNSVNLWRSVCHQTAGPGPWRSGNLVTWYGPLTNGPRRAPVAIPDSQGF
jgi:hypothetical protein